MAFAKRKPPTLAERIDSLIESYNQLDDEADALIDSWVADFAIQCPGVPQPSLRAMELDNRSTGYVHREALRRLRGRLQ